MADRITDSTTQRKLKIYTREGDDGGTFLVNGTRTTKDSLRVEAYGSIDETNTFMGLCIVNLDQADVKFHLMEIQKELHAIGANLALPSVLSQASIKGDSWMNRIPQITDEKIKQLEQWIDKYDTELPKLDKFILCGGTEKSAQLHVARTVCRRAERRIVTLKNHEEIDRNILKYINRLSDYLFTAARLVAHRAGKEDLKWVPGDLHQP
ncbi:MAG: cob(I)yrinic acid a,c-diamide adenosyltransferase [archaeon]